MSEYQAIQNSDVISPYTAAVEAEGDPLDVIEIPRQLYDHLREREYNVDWAVVSRESLVVNQGVPSTVVPSSPSDIVVSIGEEGGVQKELEQEDEGLSSLAIVKFLSEEWADRLYGEEPV